MAMRQGRPDANGLRESVADALSISPGDGAQWVPVSQRELAHKIKAGPAAGIPIGDG